MSQVKPIETRYKGFRFRSRLEARWAVFFDALGLKWEYEPEGFELPNGMRYLPDFRVTSPQGLVTWYEVKPAIGAPDLKILELSRAWDASPAAAAEYEEGLLTSFKMLRGDPWDMWEYMRLCPRCGTMISAAAIDDEGDELSIECWPCDNNTPAGGGHDEEIGVLAFVRPHKGRILVEGYENISQYKERVEQANTIARSARFEHGEVG